MAFIPTERFQKPSTKIISAIVSLELFHLHLKPAFFSIVIFLPYVVSV